jgi:hypothetical protein
MLFLNDNKNHEWSYCSLMCHIYAAEPETITTEMRETIQKASAVISVHIRGVLVYESAGADDIDAFMLHSPSGFVLVLSSEAAKLNVETLAFIFAEADQDASLYGPEIEVDIPAAYSRVKKRAQDAREAVGV